jgi:large subunit ribosomal protein L29
MKGLKNEDLRSWSDTELRARINELEEERFRLQFRSATEALEGGAALRIRSIRKDVARLHTVVSQKRIAGSGQRVTGNEQGAAVKKAAAKKTAGKKTAAKKTARKGAAK